MQTSFIEMMMHEFWWKSIFKSHSTTNLLNSSCIGSAIDERNYLAKSNALLPFNACTLWHASRGRGVKRIQSRYAQAGNKKLKEKRKLFSRTK